MDEVGKFGGVPDKENRSVVEHPVPVTFICPQFDSEAARVTSCVSRSRFCTNGGETDCRANLLADLLKQGLRCDIAEIVGHFKISMCTSASGVDLWRRC